MNTLKTICVYCGSSAGNQHLFRQTGEELADYLVGQGYRLVNGGGRVGMMGIIADRVLSRGGEAIGVIPLGLKEKEVAHLGMTELIVVPDMHSRKLKMVNLSDAFIALPGGFGTLDELFETLTWAQLQLHHKPIGLLNVGGYFDPLIAMVDRMVESGFLRPETRAFLNASENIPDLFQALLKTPKMSGDKWDFGALLHP